jgi:hypothetical protein
LEPRSFTTPAHSALDHHRRTGLIRVQDQHAAPRNFGLTVGPGARGSRIVFMKIITRSQSGSAQTGLAVVGLALGATAIGCDGDGSACDRAHCDSQRPNREAQHRRVDGRQADRSGTGSPSARLSAAVPKGGSALNRPVLRLDAVSARRRRRDESRRGRQECLRHIGRRLVSSPSLYVSQEPPHVVDSRRVPFAHGRSSNGGWEPMHRVTRSGRAVAKRKPVA